MKNDKKQQLKKRKLKQPDAVPPAHDVVRWSPYAVVPGAPYSVVQYR